MRKRSYHSAGLLILPAFYLRYGQRPPFKHETSKNRLRRWNHSGYGFTTIEDLGGADIMPHPDSAGFYASTFWRDLRRQCLTRDNHRCAVAGCTRRATHADHIERRPRAPTPTPADHLGNLRSLCAHHDAQLKERPNGSRSGGAGRIRGADANGWPLDPRRQ